MFIKCCVNTLLLVFSVSYLSLGSAHESYLATIDKPMDSILFKNDKFMVSKHFDKPSQTWYYLTRIHHKDKSGKIIKLKLTLTNPNEPMGETASKFAARTDYTLVFNASQSQIVTTYSGEKRRIPKRIQIVHGNILSGKPNPFYTLGIKENNELVVYPPGTTGKDILNDGINNALTAFAPLIENHQSVIAKVNHLAGTLRRKDPRQVIAQMDNLDILFLTCGGRGNGGAGMTPEDVIRILGKLDVKLAYNLDGGGSVSTVVNGEFINWKMDGHGTKERPRSNFLYVK